MVNTGFEIKVENLHLGLLSKSYMPKDIYFHWLEIVCFLQQEAKNLDSDGFLTLC